MIGRTAPGRIRPLAESARVRYPVGMSRTLRPHRITPTATDAHHHLVPFDPLYAPLVASWVVGGEELSLLAPGTKPPLTAAKVVGWTTAGGHALLLDHANHQAPVAYGEINRMNRQRRHYWLGHLLVDPARRGAGVGRLLTRLLIEYAGTTLGAKRLSLVVFPENRPAIVCYERCGFRLIGEQRQRFATGKRRMLYYELNLS